MPKGSKKRKASKKKAHHHHNPNHHDDVPHSSHNNGDDDMKHHEDKESDGESQDNRNSQLDLSDGEKEERKKVGNRPNTSSSSDESQSGDETTAQTDVLPITIEVGGVDVDVDQELKPVDQSNAEPQNVEIVSNEKRAYNDLEATDELKEDKSTAMEVEFIKQSEDDYLEKSSPVEKMAVFEEKAPLISSNETVKSLPEGLHPVTNAITVEENSNAVGELPDEKSNGDGIVNVPGTTRNGDKEVILLEKNLDTAPVDLKVVDKTDIALSDVNLSASPISEGKLKLSKNATTSDVMDNGEQNKDIEVSESSVRQPLLADRPQPRTSWMNCCGLFEAFAGSGR